MLNKVIDREEQKYYLSNEQYDNLVSMIKDNIVPDNYFKETIYNFNTFFKKYESVLILRYSLFITCTTFFTLSLLIPLLTSDT